LWTLHTDDPAQSLLDSNKINDIMSIMIENAETIYPEYFNGGTGAWANWVSKRYGHEKSIQALAVGYEGSEVWSSDSRGKIVVWGAENYALKEEFNSEQHTITATLSPAPHHVIWMGGVMSIKIWDAKTYTSLHEIQGGAFCFAEIQGKIWAASEEGIRIINATTYEVEEVVKMERLLVKAVCLGPDKKSVWVATTHREIFIHICDVETHNIVKEISNGHTKAVNAFTCFGNEVWSAGNDHICIWSTEHTLLKTITAGHSGAVLGAKQFGNHVWTVGWDTTIRIWEVRIVSTAASLVDGDGTNSTKREFKTYRPVFTIEDVHNDCVGSIEFVFDRSRQCWKVWTGSFDKAVCVFGISPHYQLEEVPLKASISPEAVVSPPRQRKNTGGENVWVRSNSQSKETRDGSNFMGRRISINRG